MSKLNRDRERSTETGLEQVIEPLASYICATEQPEAALMSALAVLVSEVRHLNRAALAQIATFSENAWS